ncbi:GrpB family protein [Sinomonas sp. ASV322]|uniref:GrpB family protein n=1 Tax=Sinomonas sp. ASV322 TaxID=3041920 RepID=UPI0027DC0B58|nr:GrpB family protein [Sinomonas sp. ASV322]MDQ4501628.1 GrpB family protein [Sinomonas sp. ASV322]
MDTNSREATRLWREAVMAFHDAADGRLEWVGGAPVPAPVRVVPYDDAWPSQFERVATGIRAALGGSALAVEHVGSTSVPGLPAKPVIDVDLTVRDPAVEAAYVPALETVGYMLRLREPGWHEHRALVRRDAADVPQVNLHVFGPGCPETVRHRMFRDWLRTHPEDRSEYRDAKLAAASATGEQLVMNYNRHKEPTIRAIYERMFRAAGWLDDGPTPDGKE